MNKILIILQLLFFLPINISSQTGWVQQNSGTTKNFYNVFFVDANTGYISGDTLMKTTNSGVNWFMIPGAGGYGMYFLNSETGFVGIHLSPAIRGIGKTTNGGLNWVVTNAPPGDVNAISFINNLSGWAATGAQFNGYIYKTTDGGTSWSSVYSGLGQSYVQFLDDNTGYSISVYGSLKKSTDGGASWVNTSPTGGNIAYAINKDTAFTAGLGSKIYRTMNGGVNWDTVSINNNAWSIFFANQVTGYAVGGYTNLPLILYTSNGGSNWILQQSPVQQALWAVKFINPLTGWAVGDNGTILKTTTGGIVGLHTLNEELPSKYQLHQNYPNPFNPETKIEFDISVGMSNKGLQPLVQLKIYDALGREITTLVNEPLKAGAYKINWNSASFPSGIYFARLKSEKFDKTIKMVLLK